VVRFGVGDGGVTDVKPPTTPPQPAAHMDSTKTHAKNIPRNSFCLERRLLSGPMRGHCFGITSSGVAQDTQFVCATIINATYVGLE
jgi:hypothetical protein